MNLRNQVTVNFLNKVLLTAKAQVSKRCNLQSLLTASVTDGPIKTNSANTGKWRMIYKISLRTSILLIVQRKERLIHGLVAPEVTTTHSDMFSQTASATLRSISEPSRKMQSHTRSTVGFGRQVAKRVRNHCMVKTLVNGGSYVTAAAAAAAEEDD